MKYIITFLLIISAPFTKAALTNGDFSHLSPEDLGLDKIDIIGNAPDAALCQECKIYKNGKLTLHFFAFRKSESKNEMVVIYGAPIWGDQFILRNPAMGNINEELANYKWRTMSMSGGWQFTFTFENVKNAKDTLRVVLAFSEVPLTELKNNKSIPQNYLSLPNWDCSYPADDED